MVYYRTEDTPNISDEVDRIKLEVRDLNKRISIFYVYFVSFRSSERRAEETYVPNYYLGNTTVSMT